MRTRSKFVLSNCENYLQQAADAIKKARAADASELESDHELTDGFLKTAVDCATWVASAINEMREQEATRAANA